MTERVHLLDLRVRVSAAGNRYLSGWLGKASVVGFLDRESDGEVWQIFVSTPSPRAAGANVPPGASRSPLTPRPKKARKTPNPLMPGELDDDVNDLGRDLTGGTPND